MISLLSRLFISDRQNYSDSAVRSAYGVLCGAVGEVLVNEYYRVEKQLRLAAAEAESLKF